MSQFQSYDTMYRTRVGLAPGPVFALLGVLSAVYFAITGTVWAVTGEFTRLGGHVVEGLGADVHAWQYYQEVTTLNGAPIDRTDGWIVIAMLAGSLIAALYAGDFRLRLPPQKRRFAQALAGGIIAGFGARLAYGCNLAAMFTGIPQFSLHAWIFTAATALGTLAGVKLIKQRWWRGPTRPVPVYLGAPGSAAGNPKKKAAHRSVASIVILGLVAAALAYAATGRGMLSVAIVFGAVFGILIQRGQICFTAAFRDLWVTRKTKLNDALILGLAAAVITTWLVLQIGGMDPLTKPAGIGTVIGGLLFGLGIIMAGACETGMMYRAMEGQTAAVVAFVGNIIGATVLAYGWDTWGIYATLVAPSPSFNFYQAWGPWPALIISLVLLGIWAGAVRPLRRSRQERVRTSTETELVP
ncbi:selenium metabolism membrane protein YedE/FdhT [Arthrobacter sp. Sa2CUA1]|uniref:Selenium metabolism membrane protein YedE/FdhT n=1 Tax=Arthrobacter gallicola TaxID=2762225 RepID=A0ABR8URZ6_9MICC|nr:selenium metabolism membrane protein YedE/FdhT [Arthrobacter gallicola]MBD7995308.1 selenium metabolism membrane protein YedE/FdhT [Arthrobacter gallicola]